MAAVNPEQVEKVAKFLKDLPDSGKGLNFYSFQEEGQDPASAAMYPSLNHPQTINYFFFTCMHQYGFWYGDEKGYVEPLYGEIGGKQIKGSDLLWRVAKRALDKDEEVFEPKRLAVIKPKELAQIFSDDNGPIPFPDFEKRFQLTRSYGKWFINENENPQKNY